MYLGGVMPEQQQRKMERFTGYIIIVQPVFKQISHI